MMNNNIIALIDSSPSSERRSAPCRHPGVAVASAPPAESSCSNAAKLPALVPPPSRPLPSGFGSPASTSCRRPDAAIASCPIPRYIFVPCRLPPCMRGRNYKLDPLECLFCGHRFKSSGGRASHQNHCRLNPSGRSITVKPWNCYIDVPPDQEEGPQPCLHSGWPRAEEVLITCYQVR